jgi:hypothetical protein
MLEEELIDLRTFCLQNPESTEVAEKKNRITQVGKELYGYFRVALLHSIFSTRNF